MKVLPKLRSLESILQPINLLPKDIFVFIPHFFTREGDDWESYTHFPMSGPLVAMTHVCRSWRNVLFPTPSLWTQIDLSRSTKSQQAGDDFLRRSGDQLLDIFQSLEDQDHVEPFLSTTLLNPPRLQRLEIVSCLFHLKHVLGYFSLSAPILRRLDITNDPNITEEDVKLPKVFGGQLPKLTSLELHYLRTNFRGFNFPSLTRFRFTTGTNTSVPDLKFFFERCPSLEFIQLCLDYMPQPPVAPHRKRISPTALKELRYDQGACTSGLLDHLILPNCTEVMLKGQFTGEALDQYGSPAARIYTSSIDHLPVTRVITKAVAMPNSCTFSRQNEHLRFRCFYGTRQNFGAAFFTSFSPISVSGIRELCVGQSTASRFGTGRQPWG